MKVFPRLVIGLFALAATADGVEPSNKGDSVVDRLRHQDPDVVLQALTSLRVASRAKLLRVQEQLMELADHKFPHFREDAIDLLAEIGPDAAAALPILNRRLQDPIPNVRVAASIAIWEITSVPDQVVPVLVEALASDSDWLSEHAAWTLLDIGPAAAVQMKRLLELTGHPHSHVRASAIKSLGAFGPDYRSRLEPPLQNALKDPDDKVRFAAAAAISNIDGSLGRAVELLSGMVTTEPEVTTSKYNMFAGNTSASGAAEALGKLAGDAAPATNALCVALTSKHLDVRLAAAEALGKIGPAAAESIPALSKALRETEAHSVPFVHRAFCVGDNAAIALKQIGTEAVPELIKTLEDPEPQVRASAVQALGGIVSAARQTVGPLSERLADEHPQVRIEAIKAIGRLGAAGSSAAPQLTKLLLDAWAFTSFRAGMGIGDNESVRDEALLALQRIEPQPEQVIAALAESLKDVDDVPYEAIAALRMFDDHAAAAKAPLIALLSHKKARIGAACALTYVDPKVPGLRAILEKALFRRKNAKLKLNKQLGPRAAMGLGRLAEKGESFDKEFRDRLYNLASKSGHLFGLCSLLRMDPTDERTAGALVKALNDAHGVFDAIGIREAELTLTETATHRSVRDVLVAELKVDTKDSDGLRTSRLSGDDDERLRAARILVGGLPMAEDSEPQRRVIQCLKELASKSERPRDSAAELLADCPSERQPAIRILVKLLGDETRYIMGGDFYGNGGERRVVGDQVVHALVSLKAVDALQAELTNKNVDVRIRATRGLGQLGPTAVGDRLLAGAVDADFRLRRETMSALGRIGRADPDSRAKLEPVLAAVARDDRRLSVRDRARRALRSWE